MKANTKHLWVISEECISTHSSHDSLNLSQAKARFNPSLPIITRYWDLCLSLMWNICDNIHDPCLSALPGLSFGGDHLSFSCTVNQHSRFLSQFSRQWSQIMLHIFLVLRFGWMILQQCPYRKRHVFNLSHYIPHEIEETRKTYRNKRDTLTCE